ncbi:YihY/virulence factor BrkB family protein [Maritimibacter sp. DP1N21-5]|uniref:YihY/virulence factor BrkB family protein n=1 Tax=Maritimibacter sp. DP1N21-5 TaxID=2836867 RepID=UPI001C46B35D|nr:YihY/virulence factor BrkB family protein [Maritimibacter sp. DP1N21-5]MBV7411086.1 YihY/virulence factor BrkB family protein [Maritimibacter sp. DP1N21-5]
MARGRHARTPTQIPAKGWKDIALRLKSEMARDHVGLIAAGVAYYALLALFPAITALMALGGLVLEPPEVTAQLETLTQVMPQDAARIILDQAVEVAGSREGGLGLAFAIGLLLAIYSASKGMGSLMEGLNVAYDEEEGRGFISRTLWTLALTLFLIVGLILGLVATLAVPAALNLVALPGWLDSLLALGRWVILGLMTIFGFALLYRFGPSRDRARWTWLSPGAVVGCAVWLIASVGFSIYVSNFGSYNESFGSMAGVIILLVWLWISAYIILMGAELNAEIEAQTAIDTTVGPEKPMGNRGAEKADNLGEVADGG